MGQNKKKEGNSMKKYGKSLLAFGLAMVLIGSTTACSMKKGSNGENDTAQGKEQIMFVLDWTPNTNHTGVYVAQEKGYFEEAGLDVKIVQPPEDGAEALVATGKAQFGVSFQDTLAPTYATDSPLPITAVAAIIQHNTSGILSRKGEGIDVPKGMENHKYATWDGMIETAMIQNVVEEDGGDYSKVEMIPSTVTDEYSALQSKQVDCLWVYYAWAGMATKVKGLETDYFAFKDINPVFDYYTPVIIGNDIYLEEHEDTAKAFLQAVKKGYEYAMENPEDAAKILVKQVPELDEEIAIASQQWLADQYQAEAKYWGYIDADRWNAFYEWVSKEGLVEGTIPNNIGFTNKYLTE